MTDNSVSHSDILLVMRTVPPYLPDEAEHGIDKDLSNDASAAMHGWRTFAFRRHVAGLVHTSLHQHGRQS